MGYGLGSGLGWKLICGVETTTGGIMVVAVAVATLAARLLFSESAVASASTTLKTFFCCLPAPRVLKTVFKNYLEEEGSLGPCGVIKGLFI